MGAFDKIMIGLCKEMHREQLLEEKEYKWLTKELKELIIKTKKNKK